MANVNYDKLTEKQKINLLTKNQQAAGDAALKYAQIISQGLQSAGAAALRGGVVADTRPGISGNQNIEQAQFTKLLQGGVTLPARAQVKRMSTLAKIRGMNKVQNSYGNTSTGSGIYRGGADGTMPFVNRPQPQRVL